MVVCLQSRNVLLYCVETMFTNEVMFHGTKFSFHLIQEAQRNVIY